MSTSKHIIYYVAAILLQIASSQGCTNLDGTPGNCIQFGNCAIIMSMIKESIMSTDYLNKAMNECPSTGMPKVCCPISENSPPLSPQIEPEITTTSKPAAAQLFPSKRECGFSMSHRIVGGEKADLEDFPWSVLIGYYMEYAGTINYECGGVLISNRYVLTAAHCMEGLPHWMHLYSVRLGEYDKKTDIDCIEREFGKKECADPIVEVGIEEKIFHENYVADDRNQQYDIGVIRCAQIIEFTNYIRPICLPINAEEIARTYANEYMVAGWGMTESNQTSDIKLKIKVPSFPQKQCAATYREAKITLKSGQFCAGGVKGEDSCRGDSGGALMSLPTPGHPWWTCAGIVSFGTTPCGLDGWPGVYTNVSTYINWIVSNMRL